LSFWDIFNNPSARDFVIAKLFRIYYSF
jgi:hypothetical protein